MKRYILVNGVLAWGIPTALLSIAITWFFNPEFDVAIDLPISLAVCPIAGIAFGVFKWRSSEKHFQESHKLRT